MVYFVRGGDTLGRIAAAHGMSLARLLQANPQIRNPNLIVPGEQVFLPFGRWEEKAPPRAQPQSNPVAQAPQEAVQESVSHAAAGTSPNDKIAWGKKVSAAFKAKVMQVAQKLGTEVNFLMACMAFETGETFSPSIRNAAGSGATGLIQFMPSTAAGLGTSTNALAHMDAVHQLDYVYKYLAPFRGRLHTLEDCYMAILFPAAVGKANDHVLFSKAHAPETYRMNAGLDANRDGQVTKAEAASRPRHELTRGLLPEHYG